MRIRSAISIVLGLGLAAGCEAGTADDEASTGTNNTGGNTTATAQGGSSSTSDGGSTGQFTTLSGGGEGGSGGGIPIDLCDTECAIGQPDQCDGVYQGLDDNCNGSVDENCPCGPGQASSCFKGDPSFLDVPGCLPGTMSCTELGTWGVCVGGKHATAPDNCQLSDPTGCHPISGVPFQTKDLLTGTGTFDDDADSETFTVTCPPGVTPCPVPNGTNYQALQSGEYTVTYTKTVGGNMSSCEFPLYIGARGLRVELSWNFAQGTDQDLHLHQPMTTTPWNLTGTGATQDCGWGNCKAGDFLPSSNPSSTAPQWFPPGNLPPMPVNWYEAPTNAENLCYFAPRGQGAAWQTGGEGCHSPRLDLDNISCTASVTDPMNSSFCAPENINIDYPPTDQWMRVAVHYYSGSQQITPRVRIYCDGKLAGDLGPTGFHNPESPFTWNGSADTDKVWMVADVVFKQDQCSSLCKVEPIYLNGDTTAKAPVIFTDAQASSTFSPPYLPIPP